MVSGAIDRSKVSLGPLATASFSLVRHRWQIAGPKSNEAKRGPGASRYREYRLQETNYFIVDIGTELGSCHVR